ncbi:MAG: hypothetical protein MZV70_21125 [Desulfobacterales bacterium]|nr:hypothetical protein [Desulfobacterales bacterium]
MDETFPAHLPNALRHITAAHDADFYYGAKVPKESDRLSLLSAATIQKDRVAKLPRNVIEYFGGKHED